ncbi:MAG: hypothetical protein ACJAX6_000392 [Limisphaerales bacterium]|jgi:hypothetical protein
MLGLCLCFFLRLWISGRLLENHRIGEDSQRRQKEGAKSHHRGDLDDSGTTPEPEKLDDWIESQ